MVMKMKTKKNKKAEEAIEGKWSWKSVKSNETNEMAMKKASAKKRAAYEKALNLIILCSSEALIYMRSMTVSERKRLSWKIVAMKKKAEKKHIEKWLCLLLKSKQIYLKEEEKKRRV